MYQLYQKQFTPAKKQHSEELTEGDSLADQRAAVATEQPMLATPVNLAADADYEPAYAVYKPVYTYDSANALYDVAVASDSEAGLQLVPVPASARTRLTQCCESTACGSTGQQQPYCSAECVVTAAAWSQACHDASAVCATACLFQ